jgi:hypothetical protein
MEQQVLSNVIVCCSIYSIDRLYNIIKKIPEIRIYSVRSVGNTIEYVFASTNDYAFEQLYAALNEE